MKYAVRKFKSLAVALKELKPFIRKGRHLQTGRPFKKFGDMRSREMVANWLLCVAINAADDRNLTFCSDPRGGDGIIRNPETGETWAMEHVMVPRPRRAQEAIAEELILNAIQRKCVKGGAAYGAGKTLVVFLDAGAGPWCPNKVARRLPHPLHFAAVWVVAFQEVKGGEYIYAVAHLDLGHGDAPVLHVHISENFDAWKVEWIQ